MYAVPYDITPVGTNGFTRWQTRATAANVCIVVAEVPDLDDYDYLNCGVG